MLPSMCIDRISALLRSYLLEQLHADFSDQWRRRDFIVDGYRRYQGDVVLRFAGAVSLPRLPTTRPWTSLSLMLYKGPWILRKLR